jgi:hypothetical protein
MIYAPFAILSRVEMNEMGFITKLVSRKDRYPITRLACLWAGGSSQERVAYYRVDWASEGIKPRQQSYCSYCI